MALKNCNMLKNNSHKTIQLLELLLSPRKDFLEGTLFNFLPFVEDSVIVVDILLVLPLFSTVLSFTVPPLYRLANSDVFPEASWFIASALGKERKRAAPASSVDGSPPAWIISFSFCISTVASLTRISTSLLVIGCCLMMVALNSRVTSFTEIYIMHNLLNKDTHTKKIIFCIFQSEKTHAYDGSQYYLCLLSCVERIYCNK